MLLSARTAAFTDHLSSWSHSLEVDCGHLKTALDRAPHEGYGRELLRHMEKEVAGLEQSLGQIHAATFSAGSLSSMLASALQYQAESEAQLARVETHLEQYGYTPVERTQPEQEAAQYVRAGRNKEILTVGGVPLPNLGRAADDDDRREHQHADGVHAQHRGEQILRMDPDAYDDVRT